MRPKEELQTFRTHDIGRSGHSQRVAGKRSSGSWSTLKWLISKEDAHVEGCRLVGDDPNVRKILSRLGSSVKHVRGDRFSARPRPNVPERKKPTAAQRRARRENIARAQKAARRKR